MVKAAICLLTGVLVISLSSVAPAVVETFDYYTGETGGSPPEYAIYGDYTDNTEVVAAWSIDGATSGNAGIAFDDPDTYAFGSGSGANPGIEYEVGIMDFGMHEWGMTSGVIADYLGAGGKDLHGGWMSVRALLSGFAGKIQLGFVSDRVVNHGDGAEWDEFYGSTFTIDDSFDWYQGLDLNDYKSFYDDTAYGDTELADVKVLGVWVTIYSNVSVIEKPTITGELQVDEIQLTPEPSTLLILGATGFLLLGRRFKKS